LIPLEDNFGLYYYARGRHQLDTATVAPPALGQWHRLRVIAILHHPALSSPAAEAKLDTAKIEQLTRIKGEPSEKEGVFKVTAPRSDLKITVLE
jgi:hypothetical protein